MKFKEILILLCKYFFFLIQVYYALEVQSDLAEQDKLFKTISDENKYNKVTDEEWIKFTPEKKCQLIIEKLENDMKNTIIGAKENLIIYSILRPIPVDDSGSCFKRIILWHYEKVELVKSDPKIVNYEDIIPVRLLLLGMSPNQTEKEPRDLAEIPDFLDISCKQLLSQKPRMRWPLAGARYHPYIANVIGFQKIWIYRVTELLSACAQHIYQSLNGYMIIFLVSTEQMVDNSIFGDFQNAWKDRFRKLNKEDIILDMDAKKVVKELKENNRLVIEFEIPDEDTGTNPNNSIEEGVEIEEVIKKPGHQIIYSPDKLPVFEMPHSVSSEICAEVGTKEIPGLSKYKKFPITNPNYLYSSIIVPSNRNLEKPIYTLIRPEDRANLDLNEYRNFWMKPSYVNKYRDGDSLKNHLIRKTHLYWPNTSDDIWEWENEKLVKPYDNLFHSFDQTDYELKIQPNTENYPESLYALNGEEPLIQPYQLSEYTDSYEYGAAEYDPQIQRYAYYDREELSEEERSVINQGSDIFFSYPKQKIDFEHKKPINPKLKISYQGLTGKKIRKKPYFNLEDISIENESQDDNELVPYSKFRDFARDSIVKWYIDDNNHGNTRLTGRDRKILKKLFSYVDEVNPEDYEELMSRGSDYTVRNIIRIGKSKDKNFDRILLARKNRNDRGNRNHYIYKKKKKRNKNRKKNRKKNKKKSSRKSHKNLKKYKTESEINSELGIGSELELNSISDLDSTEIIEIPKDIFIKDILTEKYDFKNILKKERLKRFHKKLKNAIEQRMSNIEKKEKAAKPIKTIEILKNSVVNEKKNREQLENEYKKNLEEHAKILDLLKKNQERLREKMQEEHKKKQQELKNEMNESINQMEMALDKASGAIHEIEKEKKFLDEKLKNLEGDNKHIRSLINMKDNYIKKIERSRLELESKQELEIKEMKENYERQLNELKQNLSKDDTITGLNNMLNNLEYEAKRSLERIDDTTLNEEKIAQAIEQRLKDREKQLELAYQKQKKRDTEYLSYALQLLETKESESAKKVIDELKNKISELEEKQDELQHTREELEMINSDLIQTVEDQNKNLRNLMKKTEDLKVQKETALEELNLANAKLNDIKQVEKRLKDQLEEIKKSGAPSDEILNHLQKSLKVAENERKLAMDIVKNAQINFGNSEKNVNVAIDKLEQLKKKCNEQKVFEQELKAEIDKRLKINKNAILLSGQGENERIEYLLNNEIKPLTKAEANELNKLREMGLDELTDEEKKKLLMLGQRQLATMELSVVSTLGDLNNQISQALDNDEKEKSKVLWNHVSESSINRMEVENSLGEILLEKIEGQEQSINNMKNLLEETQNTISELNKQLLLQRELSGEASQNIESSNLQIYNDNKANKDENEEISGQVFEELSTGVNLPNNDNELISTRIESPPLLGLKQEEKDEEDEEDKSMNSERSVSLFKNELENKLQIIRERSNSIEKKENDENEEEKENEQKKEKTEKEDSEIEEKSEKNTESSSVEEKKTNSSSTKHLGRMEHIKSPLSIQKMMHESMEYDPKNTIVANTNYEENVNKHVHPTNSICSDDIYMLHDVQKERPPSASITCENIINTIKKNLDHFLKTYESNQNNFEVMTRTVLPGLQYDECYNSTIITFENFQDKLSENGGAYIRVFVLLTDFTDTLMIGDLGKMGYLMSNIPSIIHRVLKNTNMIENNINDRGAIETVINNFPSEWIHDHMRTCKEFLSGKSFETISKSKSMGQNVFSPISNYYSTPTSNYQIEELKNLPPIFLANIEIAPRPDKEPCIRIIKRIKRRISEVNGLLIRKRELEVKLNIKNAHDKLFVFTFEDTLPYDLSNSIKAQYCEKYLSELFIKMNNMEWRAKPKNNSLVRLITIPTSTDNRLIRDQINFNEWQTEALRLAFDQSITNEWMGNSLIEYLTNKRILKNGYYLSNEMAKELTIKLLDTIDLKDVDTREILNHHGWGISNANKGSVTHIKEEPTNILGKIMNNIQEAVNSNPNIENNQPYKTIPGIILILRTSNKIPNNTSIDPSLLSLRPDESPYLIEKIKNNKQENTS